MNTLTKATALTATLFVGAIFGFFYAYVCSAMWGLDVVDPRVAIPAMQGINNVVRNAAFFPAFFLTPVLLLAAGLLFRGQGDGGPAAWFVAAALAYFFGGLVLTAAVNVPMNNALGELSVPENLEEARAIWEAYSPRWQLYNLLRTVASGVALLLAAIGLLKA